MIVTRRQYLFLAIDVFCVCIFCVFAGFAQTTLMEPKTGVIRNVPTGPEYNGNLVVRTTPDLTSSANMVGHVSNGDTVSIEGTSGSWYLISAPIRGYVWASYVQITDSQPLDPAKIQNPLPLEVIMYNSNSETRLDRIEERKKYLDDNYQPPAELAVAENNQ